MCIINRILKYHGYHQYQYIITTSRQLRTIWEKKIKIMHSMALLMFTLTTITTPTTTEAVALPLKKIKPLCP